jgi:hypothetical protein
MTYSLVKRFLSPEIADAEPGCTDKVTIADREVEPVCVASGVAVHSHEEIEVTWASLDSHVEVPALEIGVKCQHGGLDLGVVRHSVSTRKYLPHFFVDGIRIGIVSFFVQQIGVVPPGTYTRQIGTEVDQFVFVFSFGFVQFLDDSVYDVRVVVDREDVTEICLVAAPGTPPSRHVRLEGVRTVGNLAGRIQFHLLALAKGVLPLVRNTFFHLLRMKEREIFSLLFTMAFESFVHKDETTYNYFWMSSHHKRAQGRPATTMLSPVI